MSIKINKKSIAILALSVILSGCSVQTNSETKEKKEISKESNDTKEEKEISKKNNDTKKSISKHQHLIINFGNLPMIFRECENDIQISINLGNYSSEISYYIKDVNDKQHNIFKGTSNNYNYFDINNMLEEKNAREIEQILIDNSGARVYKLIKK